MYVSGWKIIVILYLISTPHPHPPAQLCRFHILKYNLLFRGQFSTKIVVMIWTFVRHCCGTIFRPSSALQSIWRCRTFLRSTLNIWIIFGSCPPLTGYLFLSLTSTPHCTHTSTPCPNYFVSLRYLALYRKYLWWTVWERCGQANEGM